MQSRSFIIRCTAFFLLLIFLQKSGAGLLLHNVLHTNQAGNGLPEKQTGNKDVSFSCNCIDDFLMPFAEPGDPVVVTVVEKHESPVAFFNDAVPFRNPVLTSLRGPPSYVL